MSDNMFYGASHFIFQRAEELRKNMTSAENIIWKHIHINDWKLKFRRQHPILFYVVDFYCHQLKLVIEIDGGIHDEEEIKKNDEEREATLKSLGLTMIRFKNEEVYKNPNTVIKKIDQTIRVLLNTSSIDADTDTNTPKQALYIVKIGGNIIDNEDKLKDFLKNFAAIQAPLQGMGAHKILVHGGGKMATKLAEQLGIPQQLIDGRRITDAETLKIVTMVYAGYINKNIVAQLQGNNCNAIGLSGADGNAILAHKRLSSGSPLGAGVYGFAGDIDAVNTSLLKSLLEKNRCLVIAPITHDGKGQLLNTNADTIAQEIAKAMSAEFDVQLIFSFEKAGVLLDANDNKSVIKELKPDYYKTLKEEHKIFAGMIPKLDNAFAALAHGVKKVIIGNAEDIQELTAGKTGTSIVL